MTEMALGIIQLMEMIFLTLVGVLPQMEVGGLREEKEVVIQLLTQTMDNIGQD